MISLEGREVILGVTGGIAAYKTAELARGLKAAGAGVTVVMTASAAKFVTPVTFGALTGRPVYTDLFETPHGAMPHIELTARADIFIVAPATANTIGKVASGIADDLLSTMLMAARCPVLLAPAMNCRMFENTILQRNIRTLIDAGVHFVGPEEGPMACNEQGWGRMSEPGVIMDAAVSFVTRSGELAGKKVVVSAGPTIEDIDPIRYIGNRSSGRMGYAVAREAFIRGAEVTLVTGPTSIDLPKGVNAVRVRSASEMDQAMKKAAAGADIIVMVAAVADYAPAERSAQKIKKGSEEVSLKLVRTHDILKGLGAKKKKGQIVVGFAAETEDLEKNAMKKLKEKNLDLVAANTAGGETGFGGIYNELKIYGPRGLLKDTGKVTKDLAARALIECIISLI